MYKRLYNDSNSVFVDFPAVSIVYYAFIFICFYISVSDHTMIDYNSDLPLTLALHFINSNGWPNFRSLVKVQYSNRIRFFKNRILVK